MIRLYIFVINNELQSRMDLKININDEELKAAATSGNDAFLRVFTDEYRKFLETDELQSLNAWQYFLLEFAIFRDEMDEGGFLQLIQNGYGPYIFKNPFAKYMRLMGAVDLSKLIYKARDFYDAHQKELEEECTEDEFIAKYERYDELNDLDDLFIEDEDKYVSQLAHYVDEHISDFTNKQK